MKINATALADISQEIDLTLAVLKTFQHGLYVQPHVDFRIQVLHTWNHYLSGHVQERRLFPSGTAKANTELLTATVLTDVYRDAVEYGFETVQEITDNDKHFAVQCLCRAITAMQNEGSVRKHNGPKWFRR